VLLLRHCRITKACAEAGKQGDARDKIATHFVAPFVGSRSSQKA
jgi:hypothetical protein